MTNQQTLAVVGLGYVGLPLALLANEKGYKVFGIDVNQEKVSQVNSKRSPFKDHEIETQLKESSIIATTNFDVIRKANIVIVCVPTPVFENRLPNYSPVENAFKSIAPFIKKGQLIILESTVNPGVCDELVIPLLNKLTNLKVGSDYYLAHCPERINPGDTKWRVHNIPRVVGGFNQKSLDLSLKFYKSIIDAQIKPMVSLKEAEAVKIVENSFRNINIAFVNELAQSFSKLGIDVVNVIDGAATKPFAFMAHYPGCGVGGHCIPVDPYYLIDYAQKQGFTHRFLSLSLKVNEEMPELTAKDAINELEKLGISANNSAIAVLGLSYKANIDDSRESPSYKIIDYLKKKVKDLRVYDPYIPKESNVNSLDSATKDADAIILATAHKEFIQKLFPEYLIGQGVKVIIDGRNCLEKESFSKEPNIVYKGIGR